MEHNRKFYHAEYVEQFDRTVLTMVIMDRYDRMSEYTTIRYGRLTEAEIKELEGYMYETTVKCPNYTEM